MLKQNQQLIQLVRQKIVRQRLILWNNMKVMLSWHWVYLRKIVNVLTVTFIRTLSLTYFNLKIEHANISKVRLHVVTLLYFSA